MLREINIDQDTKKSTLVLNLQEPTPSSSGKTLVIVTTHGNVTTDAKIQDKPMSVGINAYIRAK